jgi:hypothetical protein
MLCPLSLQSILSRAAGCRTRKPTLQTVAPSQRTQLYPGNEGVMTAPQNPTIFLLPIPQSLARALSGGHVLLPPQGLPIGFLARDMYSILVQFGYTFDSRMDDLRAAQLSVRPRRPRWYHYEKSKTNGSPTLRRTGQ